MYLRYKDWPEDEKETPEYDALKEKIDKIRSLYPRNLSEAEPQQAG
jgi:hypothetical protein